ncbi:sulfatase-like hydrolase/transferase [Thalassospira lohafexi]|uniref:Sulfatase N-terminal domain-containing protein n=1 Tax=Thalassospira lohafexi TaxID=744227 RepID=A0A2N3L752_9PROT|nr:sulfatase-like hydrolase/transferase [Thalassospira lohafexi]PKR58520.1 hypothetical protein COO92_12400 [Thalassospira lohafexi]
MTNIFSEINAENFQKTFLNVSKNVLIVLFFFVVYKINSFTFYMNFFDFFIYFSISFLLSQLFSLFVSVFLFSAFFFAKRFLGGRGYFSVFYKLISSFGYSISLFSFVFSVERIFIDQYWLNKFHFTEVWRAVFELFYGIAILLVVLYLALRSSKREALLQNGPDKRGAEEYKVDGLKRRLLLTSSASAAAAITVGSKIVMGNHFGLPVASSFEKKEDRKNVLLITFDALAAADMSVYGYGLKTTPHIDAFADLSDVHTNFYACSTFTTPCISTILTGRYPSRSHVHQLHGMLHEQDIYRTLPAILKAAGYKTGMICGNPYAMPLIGSTHGAFDHLWAAPRSGWSDIPPAELVALPGMTDMMDLVERTVTVSGLVVPALRQEFSQTPPHATFEAAKKLISKTESPFFIWIHVMAPHGPFLPSEEFRHRFLKPGLLETRQDMLRPRIMDRAKGKSKIQTDIEHLRLRYNEWVSEADSAFGEFMAYMSGSGLLDDTTTILSADHGEFFMPDSYGHGGNVFHKALVNIPMIVRMPGQKTGRCLHAVADQTSIAPTVLEIAGLSVPEWMQGGAMYRSYQGDAAASSEISFTQYLEQNSSFEPISTGTIGAVTSGMQYVRELATGEEKLYQFEDNASGLGAFDRVREDVKRDMPDMMRSIRQEVKEKFPELNI